MQLWGYAMLVYFSLILKSLPQSFFCCSLPATTNYSGWRNPAPSYATCLLHPNRISSAVCVADLLSSRVSQSVFVRGGVSPRTTGNSQAGGFLLAAVRLVGRNRWQAPGPPQEEATRSWSHDPFLLGNGSLVVTPFLKGHGDSRNMVSTASQRTWKCTDLGSSVFRWVVV